MIVIVIIVLFAISGLMIGALEVLFSAMGKLCVAVITFAFQHPRISTALVILILIYNKDSWIEILTGDNEWECGKMR